MTEQERELDFMVADLCRELQEYRKQLFESNEKVIALQHKLEHIHAIAQIALEPEEIKVHDDKDSY